MQQHEERKRITVVAAALVQDGRVLATQRGYGEWRGWWEFPGGKIEPGESPQETLRRELSEELALEAEVGSLIGMVEYDYPAFHITMHLYRCTPLSSLELREHSAARWLAIDELPDVGWLPADVAILPRVAAVLEGE